MTVQVTDHIVTVRIPVSTDGLAIINLARYAIVQDAMKRLSFTYYDYFRSLEGHGIDCEPVIRKFVKGNENFINHLIKICKDKTLEVNEEDVQRCHEMLDVELEMFLNPNTSFESLYSIIRSFDDEYSKTRWRATSKTIESMRKYFGIY